MEYYLCSDDLERYYFLPYIPAKLSGFHASENYANSLYHSFNNGQYPYYGPYMWVPVVVQTNDYAPTENSVVPSFPDSSSEAFVSNRTITSLANYQSTVLPSSAYPSTSSCNELNPLHFFNYNEIDGDNHSTIYNKNDFPILLDKFESTLTEENFGKKKSNSKVSCGSNINFYSSKSFGFSNSSEATVGCNLDCCVGNLDPSKNKSAESMNESVDFVGDECCAETQNTASKNELIGFKSKHANDLNGAALKNSASTKNKLKPIANNKKMTASADATEDNDQNANNIFLSFGTKFHSKGTCSPCWFEWSRGCHMGIHCRFCHDESHMPAGASRVIPSDETLAKSSVNPELILKGIGSKKHRRIRTNKSNGNKIQNG